jgi:hypothetical protein
MNIKWRPLFKAVMMVLAAVVAIYLITHIR